MTLLGGGLGIYFITRDKDSDNNGEGEGDGDGDVDPPPPGKKSFKPSEGSSEFGSMYGYVNGTKIDNPNTGGFNCPDGFNSKTSFRDKRCRLGY